MDYGTRRPAAPSTTTETSEEEEGPRRSSRSRSRSRRSRERHCQTAAPQDIIWVPGELPSIMAASSPAMSEEDIMAASTPSSPSESAEEELVEGAAPQVILVDGELPSIMVSPSKPRRPPRLDDLIALDDLIGGITNKNMNKFQ